MIETAPHTSELSDRLRERIKREGPITFCDWMRSALYDPTDGYYCRSDRAKWGREGDYRTSPERSSLFAATFARYFARLYDDLHKTADWTIVEAGGGDGMFASGVLQTLQNSFPEVFSRTRYIIDELSSAASSLARDRLHEFGNRVEFRKLDELEVDQGVVFSNELLDAFPVHRVTMQDGKLNEFYVNVASNGNFEWIPGDPSTPQLKEYLAEAGLTLADGQVAEINFEIEKWLKKVGERLRSGYLITVDYGAESANLYSSPERFQGTLRGFYRHQTVNDVLARPGEQDLTTTVDWSLVKRVGRKLGFELVAFEPQDKFLVAAGLLEQLESESRAFETEAEKLRLSTAAREMILPGGMASSFQVLVQRKT